MARMLACRGEGRSQRGWEPAEESAFLLGNSCAWILPPKHPRAVIEGLLCARHCAGTSEHKDLKIAFVLCPTGGLCLAGETDT